MLNLGIIGLGYMGRTHLGAAEKLDGVQVVAVADARDPGAVRFRGQPIPVYGDASGLLRHEGLGAVAICVPTYLHEECVTAAAAAGKSILCEKPFALHAASAARMLRVAQVFGVRLMIAQVLRFWPHYVRLRQMVRSGEIGAVRTVSAWRLAEYPTWGAWFKDPSLSGGCILDLQVHDIDFVCWLLGAPAAVRSTGRRAPSGAIDHVFTELRYPETLVHIEASYMMPRGWPFRMGIRVNGDNGCLEYVFDVSGNVRERERAVNGLRLYRPDGTMTDIEVSAADSYEEQLRYFCAIAAGNEWPVVCPPEESLGVMRVVDACRESAEVDGAVRCVEEEQTGHLRSN
jgi:predicted dehydrogenase